MVGGPAEAYERVRPIIEGIAARYRGDPCAAHLGPDGAGHFLMAVFVSGHGLRGDMQGGAHGLLTEIQGAPGTLEVGGVHAGSPTACQPFSPSTSVHSISRPAPSALITVSVQSPLSGF